MVGLGKRFFDAGYLDPKPLIKIEEKTIVQHAIDSLGIEGQYIFVIRKSNFSDKLKDVLYNTKPDSIIIEIDYLTDGTVSSILLAKEFIDNDTELITTNCDQRTIWDSNLFLNSCRRKNLDGCVATYPYDNIIVGEKSPYSFIKTDENNLGLLLDEKTAISNLALCGIHYWRKGSYFVNSAVELLKNNDRVNNEFYVSKTYNYLIKKGMNIGYHSLNKGEFYSLGTPEDIKIYENRK
jgi:NDP-sugar pyrophosphorylase family protein